MDENGFVSTGCASNGFKEAVCIDAMRVYDSCSETQPSFCHSGGRHRSRISSVKQFRSEPGSFRYRMVEISSFHR